jgi:hypothetical protein
MQHTPQPARHAEPYGRGANGSGTPLPARDASERNGHFVVSERTARFDDEGDETDGELPELPQRDVRGEVGTLIDSLRAVFEHDRTIASQGGSARCGICYLHYPLAELEYRTAEGYYVCSACAQRLGSIRLPMVRRQQR